LSYGICRVCGGSVVKDWGGIIGQFHCVNCGVCITVPGRRTNYRTSDVARVIRLAMRTLNRESCEVKPLMRVVNKMMNNQCPKVSKSQLEMYGIIVVNNLIKCKLSSEITKE
jgi:hypothetical protein